MGSFWRRLRKLLRDRVDQRITRAGVSFTVAVILTGAGAFLSGNNLIFLITSALLATFLVSGLVNRLSLAGLEVEFHPPQHLFARQNAMAKLIVKNDKFWMPSFATRLGSIHADGLVQPLFFALIAGGDTVTEYASVRFSRRGRFRDNSLEFTSRFPFGFAERRARVTLLADVIVYPALEPSFATEQVMEAVNGELHARSAGQGDDFYRLRPYTSADSARRIDWRTSARQQELYVREYSHQEAVEVHVLIDLYLAEASAEWLERTLESAAWLFSQLDQGRLDFSLRTQGRILRVPEDGDLYTVLAYLAVAEPSFHNGPLRELLPEDLSSGLFVVFTCDAGRVPAELAGRAHVVAGV